MPRQLRIEYPRAIYQVMNRGDRREPIFHMKTLKAMLFLFSPVLEHYVPEEA